MRATPHTPLPAAQLAARPRGGPLGAALRALVLLGHHPEHNPGIPLPGGRRLLVWPLIYLRNGVYYRYPLCCTLRFAFSGDRSQGRRRGSRRHRRPGPSNCFKSVYVVCSVLHRPDPDRRPTIDDRSLDHLYAVPKQLQSRFILRPRDYDHTSPKCPVCNKRKSR